MILAEVAERAMGGDGGPVPTLDTRDLGLTYASGQQRIDAIHSVSLSIAEGEFVSIVGPSGCGKSSFLKIVYGLQPPSAGTTAICGARVNGPRRDVGMVFQSPVLLPWRTIIENVLLPADVLRLDRALLRARALELLAMVGLAGFENVYPHHLSGGMQQRAGIVRALVHDPKLLLMDEPFAALDAITREQMALELQRIWMASRKTILFVTHSISEAVLLSDRVVLMSARPGRILRIFECSQKRPRSLDDLASPHLAALVKDIRHGLDQTSAERAQ
jgi:NitT/TauT family transport system ATP-binding protein